MLKVPKLDDVTYDQMMNRYIHKIPSMTDQWTDFNYHDPGITVLQTYAWLVDMLNYYMDATGDIHILKYLKLLGLEPQQPRMARVFLDIEARQPETVVRDGTPVYAGQVCFETIGEQRVCNNRFVSYINEKDGAGLDLTMFAGVDGDYASLFASEFRESAVAYFGFERELPKELRLQICVQENGRRNPFDREFSMSSLKWQYYGAQGWKELESVEDGTCGFLKSGIFTARLPEHTVLYQYGPDYPKAHYIRCILEKNTYDMLPKIGQIFVNPVPAVQKRTMSKVIKVAYEGQRRLEIPCYIPKNAYLMVGIQEEENKGHLLYDEGSEQPGSIRVEPGEEENGRVLVFTDERDCPPVGSVLQIFLVQEEFMTDFRQTKTDGCANQEIEFSMEGICEIAVSTWTEKKNGQHSYEQWRYVPLLEQAGYRDKVFTYDFGQQKIIFGDGEHGAVPGQGQTICITGLAVSEFGSGNVLEKEIYQSDELEGRGIRVTNPLAAYGGRNQEKISEMIRLLPEKLFCQKRLVSVEDYKKIVAETPGLMIEEVEVISGKRYGEIHDSDWTANEVVVVVKPYSEKERPALNSFYKNRIADYIEELRLLNTKVSVVSPSYVGIEVNGKIQLAHRKRNEEAAVTELLQEMILSGDGETHFGKTLVLGKLFSRLEILEEVERVHSLSLERIGSGAVKNQRGDIRLFEDSLCYISSLNIEFC